MRDTLIVALAGVMALVPSRAPGATLTDCAGTDAGRVALTVAGFAVADATVIAARAHAWWLDDPSAPFHFVWGTSASSGQNVLLHAETAYQAAQVATVAFDWACVPRATAGWLGAALGFAAQLPKQIGDGFHAEGLSVATALWSGAAAGLVGARRAWSGANALQLKVWYWPSQEYLHRPGPFPQLESDYAGQRYFLAFDPGLAPRGVPGWPAWLGVAVGHGVTHWISAPPDPV